LSTLVRAIAVAAVLTGAVLFAQPAGEPVTLDIVVEETAAQRPPLSAADFVVTDDGEALPVESVRLVQPLQETAALPPVSGDDDEKRAASQAGRLVGVYVDEYHLGDDEAFAVARDALAGFLRSSLGPRDLVVVLKPLDSLLSLRMSSDREAAARIVEAATPRLGDYAPRSVFEQEFIAGDPARIDTARNQIALSAVSAIAAHLGRFEAGRKTIVVLSNGVSPAVSRRGDAPLPGVDSIARSANRARVAIYLMRPSRPTASLDDSRDGSAPLRRDALEALATQTTGFVMDGADATASGLQHVLRDASRYYLLTLAPSARASDGRFRSVNVTLRKPQLAVRARAGYALHRPDDEGRVTRTTLPEGLKIPRRTSPLIRTWFGQSAGESGATLVDFVWEPSPRVPGGRGPAMTPARVAMRVSTMDGVEVYSGSAGPSGTDHDFGISEPSQMAFSATPATLLVQMEVLDLAGRVLDRDVRDLTVAGFTKPLAFGTTAVFRSRTNREFLAIADGSVVAAPVASRQFSRAEHLVFRIPVSSGGSAPAVTARLQSRFGAALRELPVINAPSSTNVFQVDLPLAAFASGGYTLEFSARSSLGSAIERIEFTVTP
jgi:VWFA-related protein